MLQGVILIVNLNFTGGVFIMDLNNNDNCVLDIENKGSKNNKQSIFKIIILTVTAVIIVSIAGYFYLENRKVSENTNRYIEYSAEICSEISESRINIDSISFSNNISSIYVENGYYWGMDVLKDYGNSIFAEEIAEEKNRFEQVDEMYEQLKLLKKTDENINALKDKMQVLFNEYKIIYDAAINGGSYINFDDFDEAIESVNQELEKLGYKFDSNSGNN